MVFFIVLRIVFYFLFNDPAAETSENEIKRAFWMGARFDLRLSILLTFPILILSMLPVINMGRSSRVRCVGKWIYGILIIGTVFFYCC